MFGFLKNVFDNTVGKVVNTIGQSAGGILKTLGLDGLVSGVAGMLGSIPGFGGMFGGLLRMVPKLLNGQIDLTDALRVASLFLPPPASAIASMTDLSSLTGAVVGQVGGIDPSSAGGQNLLHLVQNLAFGFAGQEMAAVA
jgi:hypothetical protein